MTAPPHPLMESRLRLQPKSCNHTPDRFSQISKGVGGEGRGQRLERAAEEVLPSVRAAGTSEEVLPSVQASRGAAERAKRAPGEALPRVQSHMSPSLVTPYIAPRNKLTALTLTLRQLAQSSSRIGGA